MAPSEYDPRPVDETMIHAGMARVEHEDEKRRWCTRLGYRLGGEPALRMVIIAIITFTVVLVFCLTLLVPHPGVPVWESRALWVGFAPLTLLPVLPFLYLKPRYAMVAVGIMAVIVMAIMLGTGGLSEFWHFIVSSLD